MSRRRGFAMSAALLIVAGCSEPQAVQQGQGPPPSGECRAPAPTVAPHPDQASADRAVGVLTGFAGLAWNPTAPAVRPSTLSGGLFVNYRPTWDGADDPGDQTNVMTTGRSDEDAGAEPRHDPLTDLIILRNLDALLATGVRDPALETLRCRLQPITEAEFVSYGVERGWVYGELVDLSLLDPDGPWSEYARTFATLLDRKFAGGIDPTAEFRPDWLAQSAAALVDAGQRFDQPRWTASGRTLALALCRVAANPETGLFGGRMGPTVAGVAATADPLVKVGSQAQLFDGLLRVWEFTGDEEILAAVRRGLDSLLSPAIGLRDEKNGGWFYAVDADGTGVRENYKETRQAWLVPLFERASRHDLVPAGLADSMRGVVRDRLFQPDSRGYVYRVRDDWMPYSSTQEEQTVVENWVSSEATGIAVHALLGPLT